MQNNNGYRGNTEVVEIDLLDLAKELLKHWKSIILCALICAVLGAGYSMSKANTASSALYTETAAAGELTAEELEAEIEADYKLLLEQYEDDVRFYDMKPDIVEEYSKAVEMLGKEVDRLKTIDESDEEAVTQCLIKISSLQSAVESAQSMRSYYATLKRPEKPDDFEKYRENYIQEREAEAKETAESGDKGGMLKFAILGLILGGCLGCGIWSMVYVFDGKLKLVSDVERYGVNILGSIDNMGLVAANVKNFTPEDVKSVLVTGSMPDATLKSVADAVAAITDVKDIRVSGKLNRNADTAVMLSEVDAVVLVEKVKMTRSSDMKEELSMVENAGKILIGVSV